MSWLTLAAVFFIIWWVTLFVSLPFGLRTQDEEGEVAPGTVASAPSGHHMRRALLVNTVASLAIFGLYYLVAVVWGIGFDDLPRIVPSY